MHVQSADMDIQVVGGWYSMQLGFRCGIPLISPAATCPPISLAQRRHTRGKVLRIHVNAAGWRGVVPCPKAPDDSATCVNILTKTSSDRSWIGVSGISEGSSPVRTSLKSSSSAISVPTLSMYRGGCYRCVHVHLCDGHGCDLHMLVLRATQQSS